MLKPKAHVGEWREWENHRNRRPDCMWCWQRQRIINPILLRKEKWTLPTSHTWLAWGLAPSFLPPWLPVSKNPVSLSACFHCLQLILACLPFHPYWGPFDSRGHALCLTPAGMEQTFVKWVLSQQEFWYQAGEWGEILCEVLPDLKLLDSVCLHRKVRFSFGVKVHGYHLGPIVTYFSGGRVCFHTEPPLCLSHTFNLVYEYLHLPSACMLLF